jgi:hypothetical protein
MLQTTFGDHSLISSAGRILNFDFSANQINMSKLDKRLSNNATEKVW